MIIGAQPLTHRPARKGRKEGPDGTSYHYIIFHKDSTDLASKYIQNLYPGIFEESLVHLYLLLRILQLINYDYCKMGLSIESSQYIIIFSYYHSLMEDLLGHTLDSKFYGFF